MNHYLQQYLMAARAKLRRLLGRHVDPYPTTPSDVHLSASEYHQALAERAPLKLAYHPATWADAQQWQNAARAKLKELLRLPEAAPTPVELHRTESVYHGHYQRLQLHLRVDERRDTPVNLFWRADRVQAPMPVMICLQGTNTGAHLSWGEARLPVDPVKIAKGSALALQAANRGYLAVTVEQSGFGERSEQKLRKPTPSPTTDAGFHALLVGRTLPGEMVQDVQSVIGWLLSAKAVPDLQPDRIFCTGYSLGGTISVLTAAVDLRLAGIAVGGCVGFLRDTVLRRGTAAPSIIPDLLAWLEYDALLGLIAPRPCIVLAGRHDHIWPFEGARRVVEAARGVFKALGADAKLAAIEAPGGHTYYPQLLWEAISQFLAVTKR